MAEAWVGLVARAREGDRMAFEKLVDRFQRPICATVFPIVKDWHATQDVAQETFAAAFLGLPRLREPFRFRAWLFRIAHNRAVSSLRAKRASRVQSLAGVPEDRMQRILRPSGCALTDGGRRHSPHPAVLAKIRRAVLALPNGYGSLLVMRYVEGLSVDELADVSGRTAKAIKAALYRARLLARQVLARSGLDLERVLHEV